MKRRQWTGKQKLQIVLEGLGGKVPLGELCARHQISQAQYYQWRDQLFNQGAKVFDRADPSRPNSDCARRTDGSRCWSES